MGKSEFKFQLINQITEPSARTLQRRVGPSSLGNPCAKCLGREMWMTDNDIEGYEDEFSMYPWIGTAVHAYLEDNVFQTDDFLHEQKLYVGDVRNYGPIKGTADLVHKEPTPHLPTLVGDWKIVGLKKIKSYRVNGAPSQYRYQAQIYARGCELAGMPVENIAIIFIPRDSGNVNDIFVHEEQYQPEMAARALDRAGDIYEAVLSDGWASLPSHVDCWQCNSRW